MKDNKLTPAQKHDFASQLVSLSSFTGFAGTFRASRVAAEELKNSSHLILDAGEAREVAIICNFSKFNSGETEFNE